MPMPSNLTNARAFVTQHKFLYPNAQGQAVNPGPPLGEPAFEKAGEGQPGSWLMYYDVFIANLSPLPSDPTKVLITFVLNMVHVNTMKKGEMVASFMI